MSKFLKGNYEIEDGEDNFVKKDNQDINNLFEDRAFEKLGGSIAFVMKSNKFVWDDNQ